MRDIKFKYIVKLSENENNRLLNFVLTLEDLENTIDVMDFLADAISEKLTSEVCDCNINESNTEHDCEYDWDYDFEILARLQYTGLKDKQGAEIYEGDIISCPFNKNTFVAYYINCFECMIPERNNYDVTNNFFGINCRYTDIIEHTYIEVIGNIYETKELLDAK